MLITNNFLPGGMNRGLATDLREPRGEMAEMIASMQAAEERMSACQDSVGKAIEADLDLLSLSPDSAPRGMTLQAYINERAAQEQPTSPPPAPHAQHTWMGGHLSLESGEHLTKYWGEAKAGIVAIKANTNQAASDGVDAALSKVSQVSHGLANTGLSTGLEVAAATLGAASGGLGVVLFKMGIKEMHKGIQHKDPEHAIEGANTVVVGTRSLAASLTAAGHFFHGSQVLTSVAGVAHSALAPLGILHGSVDAALGVKDVVQGVRRDDGWKLSKGILSVGMGSALIASAAGAGLPALAVAGGFLVGKIVHAVMHKSEAPVQPRPGTVPPH